MLPDHGVTGFPDIREARMTAAALMIFRVTSFVVERHDCANQFESGCQVKEV
jgi:hypothetical protein